eukprot:CAMPEP_0201609982 /NCGR_PEP_ID=MMETSP0492-20130828/15408_1 /ASSEMBLY_ACC=CAM_ASM_000837 /TAXON_ID=420259 /ORGANISM="Thalassiosira gravida, Strain GMp14c1" /LENGTH=238 /DNA_ID=CAMNT_0048075635 /DNA_START=228 /DNA_END=944 /DNA_ORIENTATION=-
MHRRVMLVVSAHIIATVCRIAQGFVSPVILPAATSPGSRASGASQSSPLYLKVERYGYENDEVSDEDLFEELANKNIPRGTETFDGCDSAKEPSPSLKPEEIVPLIMRALQNNNKPEKDAGLTTAWEFSTDTTKWVFKHNITEFIESCHETAELFPTSFYGVSMNGRSWKLETELNRVGGDDGWIATQVMKTMSSDGRMRRWQWELRKNKRPPCIGCWRVENIASSDRNGNFEDEDFA